MIDARIQPIRAMPILLFKLNGVPDDEARDVRRLLDSQHIDYYETHAGRWGVSVAGIWLRDDVQLERARALLERYQDERAENARAEYEQARREGRAETLWQRFASQPLRLLLMLLAILAVLYFTVMPFLNWD